MQPSGTFAPLLKATLILPSAIVQVEMSTMIGGPSCDRNARRDRVGRKPALGSAERGDQDAAAAGVDEVERDHARPGRHLGPVADPAQMARVPKRHHGHALAPGLVDAELHRLFAHHLAEAELAVDHGDRIVLEHDLERLVGQDLAGAQPVDVGRARE